jgi:hypothetical protein
MLNSTEYLLTCLSEECAEIQQICAKAQRFGLLSYHPDDPEMRTNIDKLKLEINDFFGVIDCLEDMGYWDGCVENKKMVLNKIKKLDKMMNISRELGKLE